MKNKLLFLLSFSFCYSFCLGQLTIIVDEIPANTPPDDPIHITGNFQAWNPSSPTHILSKDTASNHYVITLAAGIGAIEFKFTRGDWTKVESDANGNFVPNRTHSGSEGDTIRLQILGWEDIAANCNATFNETENSTAAENVSILQTNFYIPQLDRCRRIWIYLPPDYEASDKRYPVLYMHDGQNLFDASTSFSGEWQVDETLNRLHTVGDQGIIVIGIDNGGLFRLEEYTPWSNPNYGGGGGKLYADFIVQTLKPFVDANYRTKPDRANTGIMGSSLGGLISTYAGIEHQAVFGKIGTFSPSYWFSSQAFTHVTDTRKQADMKIYQLMGTREGSSFVSDMNRMEATLHAAGFEEEEVLSVERADGEHSEWFWAREFEAAYLWLFGDQATSVFSMLSNTFDFQIYPNPSQEALSLTFNLTKQAAVQVDFYDLKGRLLKKLDTQTLPAGKQFLTIDSTTFIQTTGQYNCKVTVDGKSFSRFFSVNR